MTRRLPLVLLLCLLACGKQTFLVAAFVQTPTLPNPTDPNGTIPAFNVITAYFGTIDTTDPTKISQDKEAPITDATASVSFIHKGTGGSDVDEPRNLTDHWTQSSGAYGLTSKDEPRLTFEEGVPYTLVLQTAGKDGEAFGARFVPAKAGDIVQFQSSHCTVALGGGVSYDAPRCKDATSASLATTPLTIDRTDAAAAGSDPLPAFVIVARIDPNNPSAEPQITYKTVPDSADKLLKYVLSDKDYRLNSFLIPTTAFPQTGYYVVSLLIVKQGKVSGNAFLGSTALAGSGAAGILHVQ